MKILPLLFCCYSIDISLLFCCYFTVILLLFSLLFLAFYLAKFEKTYFICSIISYFYKMNHEVPTNSLKRKSLMNKKLLSIFFILFSGGVLSAQNLNFKDTTALKTLLCSHTWIRYYVNPDSSFSDRVMDSIKFYSNHTYFKSAKPKDDSTGNGLFFSKVITSGNWHFKSTGKVARTDSATNYISISTSFETKKNTFNIYGYNLIDGHRLHGSKMGKLTGNLEVPYIVYDDSGWLSILILWQALRQKNHPKKHK